MSYHLHRHLCPSCNKSYTCLDEECAYRAGQEECCPSCYYGETVAVTVLLPKYVEQRP